MLFLKNLLDDISISIDEFYLIMFTRNSYRYICYVIEICYLSTNLYLFSMMPRLELRPKPSAYPLRAH